MSLSMPQPLDPFLDAPRIELVLRLADGSPWRLSLSAGIERFIGRYPRIDGFGDDGALLSFVSRAPTC